MAAPGSGIKFLGLDSALVDLAEKKSTLSNNKQEYFTASDIANGITAFDNGIVINETAADSDTRIEGQSDANLFFVDASTDRIGVGTNNPAYKLHVLGSGTYIARIESDSSSAPQILFKGTTTVTEPYIGAAGDAFTIHSGSKRNFYTESSITVINIDNNNHDFRVEGQTDATLFFTDASTDRVGVGTGSPSFKMHVNGETYSDGLAIGTNATVAPVSIYRAPSSTNGDVSVGFHFNTSGISSSELWGFRLDATTYDFNIDRKTGAAWQTPALTIDRGTGDIGINNTTPSYKLDVNGDINVASGSAYYHNGTAGLSGTYTFGGGTTGDIATMTFNGGILTAVTTVP